MSSQLNTIQGNRYSLRLDTDNDITGQTIRFNLYDDGIKIIEKTLSIDDGANGLASTTLLSNETDISSKTYTYDLFNDTNDFTYTAGNFVIKQRDSNTGGVTDNEQNVSVTTSTGDTIQSTIVVTNYTGGGGGGVTDHGALTGLSDDDHTQYILVSGTRSFTGKVSYDVHPTFATDTELVDKKYVDDSIAAGGGYTDEQAQDAVGTILTDTSEINFTYDDATPQITATLVAGSIDETKLDTSVNASLNLADSAAQSGDNISIFTNNSGYITDYTVTNSDLSGLNISNLNNDSGYITATLTNEQVQDIVGGMVSGNTETLITVTYRDSDGTLDFVVDNNLANYDNGTSGFITDYTVTNSDLSGLNISNLTNDSGYATQLSELSDVDSTVSTPNDGDIMVYRNAGSDWVLESKPAGGSNPALNDVTDVTITTVADNEVLAYNSGTGEWINQTASEAGLATSAQGALADSAAQSGDNISIFTNNSGYITDYTVTNSDLSGLNISNLTNDSGYITQSAVDNQAEVLMFAVSDEETALTTGTGKLTFRMPYALTVTDVRASVTTAPTGSVLTVDINESGTSILSTKLTIDATEKTSTTAATAPVISDSALADDAEITIDIDTIGSTVAGAGLKIILIGTRT